MSDDKFQSGMNSNAPTPGKRLIKVKRLKPKNNAVPRPVEPTNGQSGALATYSRPQSQIAENYDEQDTRISNETPQYIQEDEDYSSQSQLINLIYEQPTKMLAIASIACFIIGFGIAKLTTSSSNTTVHEGLQGVVVNPEVPKGRARCGLVDRTQGCVIYIMNPQRQDANARDFFDFASKQTGRQRFVIDTANMRYSNVKIKPGAIAQINIPPL